MKFVTTARALRDALADTQAIIGSGQVSQIAFSGVRVQATSDAVYVTASSGTLVQTRVVASALVEEPGQVVLVPRQLVAYLAALPQEQTVHVEAAAPDLKVSYDGNAGYRFRLLEATFPLPAPEAHKPKGAPLAGLTAAFNAVKHASTRDGIGIQMTVEAGSLTLDATDTFRLARAQVPALGIADLRVTLPRTAVERIARINPDTIAYDARRGTVTAIGEQGSVSAQALSNEFPNVDSLLDQARPYSAQLPVATLRPALSRLSAIVGQEGALVLTLDGDEATMEVSDADAGSGREAISLPVPSGLQATIRLTLGYLSDAISAVGDGESVRLDLSTPVLPLVVQAGTPGGQLRVTAVIQPQRQL